MRVNLISHTPDALQVAFSAIRTCYSSSTFAAIWNEEYQRYQAKNDDHIRLVKQIVSHGHTSTLEHISFTFSIEGISRACMAQVTRHRIASYSVRSQRYTKLTDIVPTAIEEEEEYQHAIGVILDTYQSLISKGYKAEDARMILPNSASTSMVMTMNLRSFMNYYNARKPGTHAQAEIQELAERMKDLVIEAEPWTRSLFELPEIETAHE